MLPKALSEKVHPKVVFEGVCIREESGVARQGTEWEEESRDFIHNFIYILVFLPLRSIKFSAIIDHTHICLSSRLQLNRYTCNRYNCSVCLTAKQSMIRILRKEKYKEGSEGNWLQRSKMKERALWRLQCLGYGGSCCNLTNRMGINIIKGEPI